ncbi:beta-N-acetylhexosaminidase [Paenibacillus glycanilyticus]|uniref:beta-N-acetylhexosaminidase n=1 Tax=Paenibacillus glycanilyticus TaxID=126569 RepID=UPI003EBC1651
MINEWLKSMSLEQKIGQLFMCGFDGTEPNESILQLLRDYHIGGVNFFRRNLLSPEQASELTASLQRESAIPLLISLDQEGGMVSGIEQGITLMPGNMALGAAGDEAAVYNAALFSGTELRAMGLNMNFAPCIDVNNNPLNPVIGVRSYGENPELVGRMGSAAVKGYQTAGITATVKHFPGHGDTSTDSHHELPLVAHDRKRLHEVELVPFKRAIASGVDAIMTAHVIFPAYESRPIPATLSHPILTGLLRGELGFEGVITTDCLEMNAVSQGVGVGEGAVMAIEAGADLVLISHQIHLQVEGLKAVIKAVREGRISESRINESVVRLLNLKEKRGLFTQQPSSPGLIRQLVGAQEHRAAAQSISERSITIVRNNNQIPLNKEVATYIIWPNMRPVSETAEPPGEETTLGRLLGGWLEASIEHIISVNPVEEEIAKVLSDSQGYRQIIVGTYNAVFSEGQQRIVTSLAAREGVQLTVVSLRMPYDLNVFPEVRGYIACYENKPLTIRSLAKVLTGEIQACGKLPVTLQTTFEH